MRCSSSPITSAGHPRSFAPFWGLLSARQHRQIASRNNVVRHGPAYRADPTFRNHQLPADVSPHRCAPIASKLPVARRSQHIPLFTDNLWEGPTRPPDCKTGQRRKAYAPSAARDPQQGMKGLIASARPLCPSPEDGHQRAALVSTPHELFHMPIR